LDIELYKEAMKSFDDKMFNLDNEFRSEVEAFKLFNEN